MIVKETGRIISTTPKPKSGLGGIKKKEIWKKDKQKVAKKSKIREWGTGVK